MIKADHHWAAALLFDLYIMRLMRKSFASFHLLGEEPQTEPDKPVLLVANHNTWWDGFFVYLLNRRLWRRKLFMMMLEEQLKRYWFFRHVGAYGISPGQPKDVVRNINYSAEILNMPSCPLLCIFPQGDLRAWGIRPLNFQRGVERIIEKSGILINLVPLAMKVELLDKKQPQVFFQFGETKLTDKVNFMGMSALETILTEQLDQLQLNINQGLSGKILLTD